MEKVSAMKKVALFLMIVGLAVVFAACQGAVGPAGDDGKDGDAGQKGDTGPQGPPGVSSLVAVSSLTPYIINDVEAPAGSGAADTIGTPPTIDGSMLFTGGHLPRTYTLTEPEATSVFTVSIDKDTGAITVAARTSAVAFDSDQPPSVALHYGTGTEFTVVAKDTFGTTATSPTISVKRNRKPRAGDGQRHGLHGRNSRRIRCRCDDASAEDERVQQTECSLRLCRDAGQYHYSSCRPSHLSRSVRRRGSRNAGLWRNCFGPSSLGRCHGQVETAAG